MTDGPRHVVLPVSALKTNTTTVFDALAAGRTVYVSKRGEVVAAFRPFEAVPEAIAAVYASPTALSAIELTARQLGREVPSTEVTEAALGLPSLVTRNGRIYGVLTKATAPQPAAVPDPEIAGARAEAVRTFQEEHPDASLDEVVEFTMKAMTDPSVGPGFETETSPAVPAHVFVPSSRDVAKDLAGWRKRGSPVEGLVEALLTRIAALLQPGATDPVQTATATVAPAEFRTLYNTTRGNPTAMVRHGERIETTGDVVGARTTYVAAVFAPPSPSVGAMWRLADLSRRAGNTAEASAWYRLALDWDKIEARGSAERLAVMPTVRIADR